MKFLYFHHYQAQSGFIEQYCNNIITNHSFLNPPHISYSFFHRSNLICTIDARIRNIRKLRILIKWKKHCFYYCFQPIWRNRIINFVMLQFVLAFVVASATIAVLISYFIIFVHIHLSMPIVEMSYNANELCLRSIPIFLRPHNGTTIISKNYLDLRVNQK